MTLFEYILRRPPVILGLLALSVALIGLAIITVFAIKCFRYGDKFYIELLADIAVIGVFIALLGVMAFSHYSNLSNAIESNYTVYINGEKSTTVDPKSAINNYRCTIDNDKRWILCESELSQTEEYFVEYNKPVPQ